jgi:hypothetical protein
MDVVGAKHESSFSLGDCKGVPMDYGTRVMKTKRRLNVKLSWQIQRAK